ncbi:MAG: adenylate/guanylate cyclase domain-containing protein [Pseudomonadota bacterium]
MAKNMFAQRFRWLSALPLFAVILALAVISIGALSGAQSPNATSREALFDYYQRLKPAPSETASPFHIIEIDRESVDAVGPWPWPRSIIADIVANASGAGAKGVILAEPVDTPDPLSPEVIGEFWLKGARDEGLARQLALLPSTDAALGRAFQQTKAAAAVAAGVTSQALGSEDFERADAASVPWLDADGDDFVALPRARIQFPVNNEIARNAQPAVLSLPVDPDGIVRRVPLFWSIDGAPTPTLAMEAARIARDDARVRLNADPNVVNAAGRAIRSVTIGETTLPLSTGATMRLYPDKRMSVSKTSAIKVVRNEGSNSQLRDKVVLIGLDRDLGGVTRLSRGTFSPAEAHALVAGQIHNNAVVSRPGWIGGLEALMVMLLGAAAIMWSQRLEFWKALGAAAIASAILFAISFSAFSFSDLLLNPLPGALALFLGAFSVAGGRSLGVVLRDDTVRGTFQGSLPEPAMKKIREEGATNILDGVNRPVTVLSCELRLLEDDLQQLSAHPDDVTNMLATASNSLRKTIIETGGAADQADGGKIYAYFNAPLEAADHVDAACSAALRLVESMDKTNAELEASTRTRGVQLHLAIGVATGPCFIGPMGHGRTNRYSAIGPAVEMASFLRKQAEFYGPAIICDEAVYRQTHHHFAYLELDRLKTNKNPAPLSIFALVGNPFIKSSKSYRSLDEAHRELLSAYRAGDWAAARASLEQVKKSPGAAIALFDIYEKRIAEMADKETPAGWDGAHVVTL